MPQALLILTQDNLFQKTRPILTHPILKAYRLQEARSLSAELQRQTYHMWNLFCLRMRHHVHLICCLITADCCRLKLTDIYQLKHTVQVMADPYTLWTVMQLIRISMIKCLPARLKYRRTENCLLMTARAATFTVLLLRTSRSSTAHLPVHLHCIQS